MPSDIDWNANLGGGFGTPEPRHEFFQPPGTHAEDSVSQTWFWGFNVPEAAINCFAYCWLHPNLGVATGGLMIYQGIKPQHLACELFDIRGYNKTDYVGDGSDIRFPNGMRIEVVEPLKHVRLTFADPVRQTSVDVDIRGVYPPVMRANNQHFEQLMKVTGKLVLRGTEYEVDSYNIRDRSWGEPRPEDHAPLPPYCWVTGAFDEDFAFNLGSHEDPTLGPDWAGKFALKASDAFKDGWVQLGGEQRRLVRGARLTTRKFPECRPMRHELELEDTKGEIYRITGEVVASTDWSGWPNANVHLGLVKWDYQGRTGWGETQEVQWNDYIWKMGQYGS